MPPFVEPSFNKDDESLDDYLVYSRNDPDHPYTNTSMISPGYSFNEQFEKVVKAHLLIFKGYHTMIVRTEKKKLRKSLRKRLC